MASLLFAQSTFAQENRCLRDMMKNGPKMGGYEETVNRLIIARDDNPFTVFLDDISNDCPFGSDDFPTLYYTTDETNPTEYSKKMGKYSLYYPCVSLKGEGKKITLKVLAIDSNGNKSPISTYEYRFVNEDWFIAKMDSTYIAEENTLDEIAADILNNSKSDLEKIKSAYDWVISTYNFDYEKLKASHLRDFFGEKIYLYSVGIEQYILYTQLGLNVQHKTRTQQPIAAMYDNKGIDKDYALILSKLLNRLSINNRIINAGTHFHNKYYLWENTTWETNCWQNIWNQVELNGKWYNLDATEAEATHFGKSFDDKGHSNYSFKYSPKYRYFLVSDSIMKERSENNFLEKGDMENLMKCPESYNTSEMVKNQKINASSQQHL